MKKILLPLLGVSFLIALLFMMLNFNYSGMFGEVEERYNAGNPTAVNLVKGCDTTDIVSVLVSQEYLPAREDAAFAAMCIADALDKGEVLNSLYDLNKRAWMPSAALIDSVGSEYYRSRLALSRYNLGQDSLFYASKEKNLPSTLSVNDAHCGVIAVSVRSRETKEPVPGVVVRLSLHYSDSVSGYSPQRRTLHFLKTDTDGMAQFCGLDTACSYSVLPIRELYEYGTPKGTVGGSLGMCAGDGELELGFTEQEHRIKLFDNSLLDIIKDDLSMTVRTPSDFKGSLIKYLALFFAVWWGAFFVCHLSGKKTDMGIFLSLMLMSGLCLLTMFSINNPLTDKLLGRDMAYGVAIGVLLVMLLSRIDFVRLYKGGYRVGFDIPVEVVKWLFKPFRVKVLPFTAVLTDRGAGVLRKFGSLAIIAIHTPLLLVDLLQATRLSGKVDSLADRLPKGTGYLALALFLTMLLFTPLGAEVGGMKVNLNVGFLFQPSEIAKYLIIVFMAAFFCVNADRIVQYSAKGNASLFLQKLKMMLAILIGLVVIVLLYMYLGDMGPAMVLTFTFIILYSIIKSKVELDGVSETRQLLRILSCDVAMLIYGVLSFIAFLYVGNMYGMMGIACLAWFVLWIVAGLLRRQVHETAIFFNVVVTAFIFGAGLMRVVGADSVADRLESRNEMCTNTWGTLPVDGLEPDAGENTQVAEGLWGIATGGLTGQGLGQGAPHVIPAFHTDMVLESLGEQTGFVGVAAVVLLLAFLLRRTLLVGYRSNHPFAFYLCLGIAIVTGVQFVIIALGSTGVIPLTGVTVPFLSYGKVSMILNIAAFGIILSISGRNSSHGDEGEHEVGTLHKKNMEAYGYPVSILCWLYCAVAVLIIGVFFNYQFIDRDNTLIRPVYVNNDNGVPVLQYNPRIRMVAASMKPGDIYDRNGVLLATCDGAKVKENMELYRDLGLDVELSAQLKRYYPFGNHLFFMLGDLNRNYTYTGRGYMAESRHRNHLLGISGNGSAVSSASQITLHSDSYRPDKFSPRMEKEMEFSFLLHDYSEWLPYLKSGATGKELEELVADKHVPSNLYLTLDACLQTELQNRLQKYVADNPKRTSKGRKVPVNWNMIRVSVVVIDANKGDLLASAMYPMPDYDRVVGGGNYYSDNGKDKSWKAYADMDLGIMYPTEPGSTAKVMTSMAAMRKPGIDFGALTDTVYHVNAKEAIYADEVKHRTSYNMKQALRYSSNCYFINLLNDYELYNELAYVYGNAGISVYGKSPYTFNYSEPDEAWYSMVLKDTGRFVSKYRAYDKRRNDASNGKSRWVKMNDGRFPSQWSWAWGQRDIQATPLAMARIASIAANEGMMAKTRFLLNEPVEQVEIIDAGRAKVLNGYMKYTSKNHDGITRTDIGGKTGTPERGMINAAGETIKPNDGWYICFIENARVTRLDKGKKVSENSDIAVAVRLERTFDGTSGMATNLLKGVVMEALEERGYIVDKKKK